MLKINMEFKKGILFVRLKGILDKKTVPILKSEVTELVKDNGINNVVFNIYDLESIDCYGINALLYNYELCKDKGNTLLCGINNNLVKHRLNNSRILNYMFETADELSAINVISVKGEL